jgi:hypothetical protein
MTLEQIKHALNVGLKVYWKNNSYKVFKDSENNYFINYIPTGNIVGLTNNQGSLIEKPASFYWDH